MNTLLGTRRQRISLVDVDPDLTAGLDERERYAARLQAQAVVTEIGTPRWNPALFQRAASDGWLGLFLLDGLMLRRVTVGGRSSCELFGPGDLIRPWDADGDYDPLPISVDWLVIRHVRMAVLDEAFQRRIARWPAITGRLVSRVAGRARYLGLIHAVTHLPRVHARVLILFWLLAERWGKVGADGVRVTIPLTHEVLAMLVGARRPTVTIALKRLAQANLMHREQSDQWLLTSAAVELLGDPTSFSQLEELTDLEAAAARVFAR